MIARILDATLWIKGASDRGVALARTALEHLDAGRLRLPDHTAIKQLFDIYYFRFPII